MNVKERNSFLAQSLDALRFVGKKDGNKSSVLDIAKLEVDWHKMHKPPIESYIPIYGLNDLWEITNDVKLMNRPDRRVRYMDDLLKRFDICFLNAGTNRRVYYHRADPFIVFKVGSDQVGRSDNTSEFHVQNNIFPFCTRTYSALPNGMIALAERVEIMTERDYKTKWASEVFDLILAIASKGFIMEDVGGNFYKNLGIRIGFGPVFADYPYVYRIDLRKTLCSYINPITGEKCNGELDYDYKKGMSEIVCDTCGTRFSAKHLAFDAKEDRIETRKGKYTMSNNFKVSVVRGNDTVLRTYNESEAASIQNFSDVVRVTRRVPEPMRPNEIVVTPRRTNQQRTQQVQSSFRTSVHRGNNRQEFGRRNDSYQENGSYQRRSSNPPKEEIIPDIEAFLYEMHQKHGKGTAIYLARRLGVYYQDPNEKRHTADIEATVRVEPDTPEYITPTKQEKRTTAKVVSSNSEDTLMQEIAQSGTTQEEAMIPMKPKTAAELAAMDKESRNENVVMGFPGEPLVDTMRVEQKAPLIAKAIENRFDHKIVRENGTADAELMRQLEKDIAEFLENNLEMNQLYRDGLDGLEVKVNSLLDHMNKVCFLVKVEMHKSSLLDVTLYPSEGEEDRHDYEDKEYENYLAKAAAEEDEEVLKDEDIQEDEVGMDHDVSNIIEFFEERIKQYSMDKYMVDIKKLSPEEAINKLSRKLLSDAVDQKNYPFALAHEEAKKFAAKYLGYEGKSIEDTSAASQL